MEKESLDELVLEYLYYQGYKNAAKQLQADRADDCRSEKNIDDSLFDVLIQAIQTADYPRALTLWDSCVVQRLQR